MNKKYKIIYEDEKEVKIKFGSIVFVICKEDNSLLSVVNISDKPMDITIPHTFPTGHKIDSISESKNCKFRGSFGKVSVSSSIKIQEKAFYGECFEELVWPDDNFCIPYGCFSHCNIKRISNIDRVREISAIAFISAKLEELCWPKQCKTIPNLCFCCTAIKTLSGLENVEDIQPSAFEFVNIDFLDFSGSNLTQLSRAAFYNIPEKCKVLMPYYVSKERLAEAYREPSLF